MAVSFYTSRVVLEVLGVDDYGVYNVVGGVITMFSFLNTSMGSATSRFLTFDVGQGNSIQLTKTFSTAILSHFMVALVIVSIGETAGVWFLYHKLNIPSESLDSANGLYQLTIIMAFISIVQVPYNSLIIAHENFSIYAYVELSNVFLRLGILFLLKILPGDKLIIYGWLQLAVTLIIAGIYRIYCSHKYPASHFRFIWDKRLLKKMISFSTWDLYGNCSVIVRSTGVAMLLNIFFGVVANAALGIANQVQSAVGAFSNNIITAVRPQIIKSYAAHDFEYLTKLLYSASRIVFLLLICLILPLIFETRYVLQLWLGIIPEYSVVYVRLTLAYLFFSTLSFIVVGAVHATGDIRWCNLFNGSLYMLVLPISYVGFKYYNLQSWLPLLLNACFVLIGCMVNVVTVHHYVKEFSIVKYTFGILCKCILAGGIATAAAFAPYTLMEAGMGRLVVVCTTVWIFALCSARIFVLDSNELSLVYGFIFKIKMRLLR